ncbi:MAG: hypothetical protein VX874_09555 [Pseudomonadota bacterium]|nr:hypothetical protein [Pseudomonadota bacterium]
MNTTFRSVALTTVSAAAGLTMSAQAALSDVVIRYSNWLPSGYFLHENVIKPWMDEVERVTEGRVTFQIAPKVIGTVVGSYDVVADRLADAAVMVPAYTTGRFVAQEGVELPWLGDDPVARAVATWRAYEDHLEPAGVFEEIKVISIFSTNTAHVFTSGATIETAADFEGLKLRTPGALVSDELELLKSVPVSKPVSEAYELMSGGVIDGLVSNHDAVVGFKLNELTKLVYTVEGGMTATATMVGMNWDAWNEISEEDRAAIDEISGEAIARDVGVANLANRDAAIEMLQASGATLLTVPAEVVDELKEITAPVTADWVARAKDSGMENPEAMLEQFNADYEEALGGS